MKEIIKNEERKEIVELKDFIIDESKIYVLYDDEKYCYILVKDVNSVNSAKYNFFGLEMRVQWDDWKEIYSLIEEALDLDNVFLYEFDNFNEFVSWYSEKEHYLI